MIKNLGSILIVLACAAFAFSQPAVEKKTEVSETEKLELKREKFDPKRDPKTDLEAAVARAARENKRIILDVGGEWCIWCKKMDYFFMTNPELDRLKEENYVWVKVNLSLENENKDFLGRYPEAPGYPHLYVLEKDGTLMHSQNTADLEEPPYPEIVVPANVKNKAEYIKQETAKRKVRSYDLQKFTDFLKAWIPAKK